MLILKMFFRLSQMYQIFVTIAEMPAHYETDFFIMRIITQAQNKRRGETPLLLFKNFPSSLD
jgi:hypothetical protein